MQKSVAQQSPDELMNEKKQEHFEVQMIRILANC